MHGLSETPSIRILPPEIANRIAAGEVVERPASVVRELLDNALDAGATRIEVEAENGGLDGIRVRDNGSGMSREDASLCIQRHATSKIRSSDDLETIRTKGFRGEALAAISAVSRFEIRTRREGDGLGVLVPVEGGIVQPLEEVGTPVGTTVSIQDLFFNTPARRKFLKKPGTELSHLMSMVQWHALANEGVHFVFIHNGNRSIDLPPVSSRAERVKQIFGDEMLNEMIPVAFDSPVVSLSGMVSRPTLTRNGAQHLFFFVNDRYVKDRLLHRAVMNGYRNLLPTGRYPVVFLFFEINPSEIDVNVHPTKQEIKFSREDAIFSATYGVIRDAWDKREEARQETQRIFDGLEGRPAAESMPKAKPQPPAPSPARPDESGPPPARTPERIEASTTRSHPVSPRMATEPESAPGETRPAAAPVQPASGESASQEAQTEAPPPSEEKPDPIETLNRRPVNPASPDESSPSRPRDPVPLQLADSAVGDLVERRPALEGAVQTVSLEGMESLHVCGQVMKSYIVAESGGGMYIIDQHAAHERLKFEEFLVRSQEAKLASQALLFPLTVDLSADDVVLLDEQRDLLEGLGFEVEAFGPKTYVVRAVPSTLSMDDAETFLKDLLGEIRHEGSVDEKKERALHTMACRAAVKFGDELSQEEMTSIVRGLESIPRRNVCPHGRPAILYLDDAHLRKLFKRTGFE